MDLLKGLLEELKSRLQFTEIPSPAILQALGKRALKDAAVSVPIKTDEQQLLYCNKVIPLVKEHPALFPAPLAPLPAAATSGELDDDDIPDMGPFEAVAAQASSNNSTPLKKPVVALPKPLPQARKKPAAKEPEQVVEIDDDDFPDGTFDVQGSSADGSPPKMTKPAATKPKQLGQARKKAPAKEAERPKRRRQQKDLQHDYEHEDEEEDEHSTSPYFEAPAKAMRANRSKSVISDD